MQELEQLNEENLSDGHAQLGQVVGTIEWAAAFSHLADDESGHSFMIASDKSKANDNPSLRILIILIQPLFQS